MKHLGKITFGLLALALSACSSDEPVPTPNPNPDNGTDVYASLTLQLPAKSQMRGTRSDSVGIEDGQDYENSVGRILVVLAQKDANNKFKYITSAISDASLSASGSDTQLRYILNFNSNKMTPNPLDTVDEGKDIPGLKNVYIFAYCNPTNHLEERFNEMLSSGGYLDDLYGTIGTGTESPYEAAVWQKNRFLMTNCELAMVDSIPSRPILVSNHNTAEKAFPLGTVFVKRVVARFDFQATETAAGLNKFDVKELAGDSVIGTVEFTDMAMFNVQKEFYYLPRTYTNWAWTGSYKLCGNLEGFVGSRGSNFKKNPLTEAVCKNNFYTDLISTDVNDVYDPVNHTGFKWTPIKNWNEVSDKDQGWPSENTDYRIWRYTTENTIPASSSSSSTSSQRVGISTGIVFRAEFKPRNTDRWNGNVVYVHNNIVYGDFKALKEYITKHPETAVASDFKKVTPFQNLDENDQAILSKDLLAGLRASACNNFKAYVPNAEGKYMMYYFYYNRHNSNGNNNLLGENEFGVVRNNIYKIRINSVNSLGEPKTEEDPDKLNEEEHAYFTVSCIVMPWTVRINDVDF